MTDTLLIEVGTEELPPAHLNHLSLSFSKNLEAALSALGIPFEKAEHFAAPRRLTARFTQVPAVQPARIIRKKGPAKSAAFDTHGNPSPALLGFARSCQTSVENLQVQETSQGSWMVFESPSPGQAIEKLLGPLIEKALQQIPAKKKMRWGNHNLEFIRPIHWITAIHGKKALPLTVFELQADKLTYGHRIHHPEAISLSHADDYLPLLRKAKVIADHRERQKTIYTALQSTAQSMQAVALVDKNLLDEVTGLVEWPVILSGQFHERFLEVPSEALISSMQYHQKCFPLKSKEDRLLPHFLMVSNLESPDPSLIIQGNERVVQARLADAKFFFEKDKNTPLSYRLEELKGVIFQKQLGTLYDKSMRIAKLAGLIAQHLGDFSQLSERAGKLCKADLLSSMVFEFPELQGIMGSYYARFDGEPDEVVLAIRESYLPHFAKDALPRSMVGICVALADRLDTLVGIFGIGQAPVQDKDPFALRRQALAIVRILIEKALALDLRMLCEIARHGYGNLIDQEIIPTIMQFCLERLKAWFLEQGIHPCAIDSVLQPALTQPLDLSKRLLAVNHFQSLPEAESLAKANKRVKNILQKAEIAFNVQPLPPIDPQLFSEKPESDLFKAIEALKKQTDPLIEKAEYQAALIALATLKPAVDAFFDTVMVMTEDPSTRQNRINLLCHLQALFTQIADISKLTL